MAIEHRSSHQPPRWLIVAAIILIVIGASLMDQAGRTQSDFWWTISGIFSGAGFILAVVYLVFLEGPSWWRGLNRPRHARRH